MKKLPLFILCMMFMQLVFAQELKSNLDESCPSPENFEYDCYWEDNEFYIRLVWDKADYESELDRFEVYKATDESEFEMIKRIVNVPYMTHYEAIDIVEEPGDYYYKVIAIYNDGCESEPVETLIILTAVDENAMKNVQIYPNPTSGLIVVMAEMMNGIEVFNSLGQMILVKDVENDEVSLDLSSFGSGIYFISILTENGNIVSKINVK